MTRVRPWSPAAYPSIRPTLLKIDLNSLLSEKYDTSAGFLTGSVLIELDESVNVLSTITMNTAEKKAVTAMPLASEGLLDFVFPAGSPELPMEPSSWDFQS